jgi:hypothetical protein
MRSLAGDDFLKHFPQPQETELLRHGEPILVMRYQRLRLGQVLLDGSRAAG